jgi:hypothetical protein
MRPTPSSGLHPPRHTAIGAATRTPNPRAGTTVARGPWCAGDRSGQARQPSAGTLPLMGDGQDDRVVPIHLVENRIREALDDHAPDLSARHGGRDHAADARERLDGAERSLDGVGVVLAPSRPLQFVPSDGSRHVVFRLRQHEETHGPSPARPSRTRRMASRQSLATVSPTRQRSARRMLSSTHAASHAASGSRLDSRESTNSARSPPGSFKASASNSSCDMAWPSCRDCIDRDEWATDNAAARRGRRRGSPFTRENHFNSFRSDGTSAYRSPGSRLSALWITAASLGGVSGRRNFPLSRCHFDDGSRVRTRVPAMNGPVADILARISYGMSQFSCFRLGTTAKSLSEVSNTRSYRSATTAMNASMVSNCRPWSRSER